MGQKTKLSRVHTHTHIHTYTVFTFGDTKKERCAHVMMHTYTQIASKDQRRVTTSSVSCEHPHFIQHKVVECARSPNLLHTKLCPPHRHAAF